MARRRGGRIGQMLLAAGLIHEEQLAQALAYQERCDCKLGSALVALGAVDEKILAVFLAMQRGMQTIHLAERNVSPEVLALVPAHIARQLGAVPIERTEQGLKVALVDPSDRHVIQTLERETGMKILGFIAPQSAILAALQRFYPEHRHGGEEGPLDLERLRSRLAEARRILETLERELSLVATLPGA